MQFIIIYIASILISMGMDVDFALQFVKDIADNGGKIDVDKLNDIYSYIPEFNKKLSKIIRFIPILNVCYSISSRLVYETKRNDLLMQLNVLGIIDAMTEEEKEEYNKKPSRFKALDVMAKKRKIENYSIVEKMEETPVNNEDLPENTIILTIGDEAYTVTGDSLDEQFDNVFLSIKIYEELLSSKEHTDIEAINDLSDKEKKILLKELKETKLKLLKAKKQIKKEEKKLKKIKK